MLKSGKIPSNLVYIFVANNQEEAEYKNTIPKELYNKIVVGVIGIIPQRQFISDYFKEGQNIISIDDDIKKINLTYSQFKNNSLDYFFRYAFNTCRKENAFIWGIYPVDNPYFFTKKKEEYTTHLAFIIGACYGYINRPNNKNLENTLGKSSNKGDVEKSILYYIEDEKVVRFNKISITTKYYNSIGGLGGWEERLKPMREAGLELQRKYREYGYLYTRPNGMTEFKLYKKPKLEGGKLLNEELDRDNPDNTQVFVDKIALTPKIKQLQHKVEKLIEDANIPAVSSGFYFNGSKKRGEIIGTKGYTFNLGGGRRRFLPTGEFAKNKENPELFKAIVEYANEILPTGFEYSVITVNKNLQAKKHKDGGNDGLGCITFLGDYTGGGLYIYDDKDKPKLYDSHNVVIAFNGARLAHETQAFKGNRYAMIFYQQKNKFKIKGVKMVGKGFYDDPTDLKVY
jgi:hypothetical protein